VKEIMRGCPGDVLGYGKIVTNLPITIENILVQDIHHFSYLIDIILVSLLMVKKTLINESALEFSQ
jgi:hypothetical protein